MRYSKKISAILAAAMLLSSTSAFAAVSDEAFFEEVTEVASESATLAATNVTVTVEQVENGTIEISNNSLASEFTYDVPASVGADAVLSDNDYFTLTAPSTIVSKKDSGGVFDNPAISIQSFEIRDGQKHAKYAAKADGVVTVYLRHSASKAVICLNTKDETIQTKYMNNETSTSEPNETVYRAVTFDVLAGNEYEIYAKGGSGRLFGIMFQGVNSSASNESLEVPVGEKVSVVATPNDGYVVSSILVDGTPVTPKDNEYVFAPSANTTISAVFEKDPKIVAAEQAFADLTIPAQISENITLPTSLADGLVSITWKTSDAATLNLEGVINRLVGKDVPVTLTATALINGTDIVERVFEVTVIGLDVGEEFAMAEITVPETITESFELPTKFADYNIVWTVDETKYITIETDKTNKVKANVARPNIIEGDKAVVITATLEGTEITRTFNATVLKDENTSAAQYVAENLVIEGEKGSTENKIIIDSDIDLPTTDETYGGKITWKSSNPKVVSTSGNVTRKSSDTTVYLTAIIEIDGVKASKEFKLVVEGTGKGSSGGSGGGGGSYSSGGNYSPSTGAGGVVGSYADYNDIVANPNINTNVQAPKFTDLGNYAWAVPHIERLVNKKIVNGIGDNKFDPSGLVTREQFATMLVRAFEFSNDTTNAKKFDDVDPEAYYAEAVAILNSMGVVKGQSETTFGVGQSITRQDMAVMCALATGIDGENDAVEFGDAAEISDYAIDAVIKMQKSGVLAGDENGNFNPKSNATRAEAAKVISAIMDAMGK